jgi:hypothetical protein
MQQLQEQICRATNSIREASLASKGSSTAVASTGVQAFLHKIQQLRAELDTLIVSTHHGLPTEGPVDRYCIEAWTGHTFQVQVLCGCLGTMADNKEPLLSHWLCGLAFGCLVPRPLLAADAEEVHAVTED